MGKEVMKFRMYCETESAYVFCWSETTPTVCPNNNTHTLTSGTTTVVGRVSETSVMIEEENPSIGTTGGNFSVESIPLSISANETKTQSYSWPFPISVFSISFISGDNQNGDIADVYIGHETTIGSLVADITEGETVIPVSSTVLQYIKIGYELTLDNGVTKELLGRVLDIDEANSEVTVETATTSAFLAATPTYVKMSIHMMRNYVFGMGGPMTIGESKIGGSYMPANTTVRVVYQNNSSEAKTWNPCLEYLY